MEYFGEATATLLTIMFLGGIILPITLIVCYFKLCRRVKNIEELNKQQLDDLEAILKTEIEIKNKKG